MIYATVNMTIGDYSSTCDNKILLYRGDKNVEIRIVMKGNKFTVLDSTYAQMIIKRPSATSVFSEPAPIQNDTVVFVITEDMIDELKEIGEYTFQVRLYDDTMTARATLPPCNSALIIERPIAVEGEAAVNLAIVNDSAVMLADTTISEEDIFTEDNKYNRTIWVDGDLITDARLNKIEDALYYINENGGNGSGGGATAPYISTELPETVMVGSDENFDLHLYFNSPNMGKGTLRVFINDADSMSIKIDQGDSTTVVPSNLFAKGTNRVVVYVLDRVGVMSNSLVFYIRYGSTEISSDFDPYSAYDYGATIRYYFTPTALDTSLSLTFYMSIDGQVQQGVNCTSDTRGYYTFPTNLSADSHYCEAYVVDSKGVKSNVLSFNLIILDADTLVVASDTKEVSVEEGEQVSLDYKAYMKYNTSFIANIYVDDALVNTGTCNADFNYYKTSSLTKGVHTVKLEVFDVTETHSDYIIWTVAVSDSTYEMLQPVNAGAMFIGTAVNKTNTDERKQYFIGHDQEGNEVLGTLSNFAYNSESGWVNDELIISGNSHVEIPVKPLANNAKYGFTLDIEFTSKQIGVTDAEVLTLWNNETNCGVKITTEKLILQSSNGNKCDLYFTDNEKTHVMFVIDRQELKAKIYLNGVMCEAFHLNDYTVDGVAYLDDFTVNSNIILGGLNTNGYCKIRNLRVYQVALTTDEIMNNFISCEIDKAKQRELSEFQKGNDLPTLYVYCDFSGLGKDDKKPCKIVYNSTNETLYGKSFNLDHKQSQLQYQGTSSMAYPIKNYRLNLRDENGDKWYYTLPTAQPECRFTLKADFMSSGHWTNTGMAKFINDKLYNYNVNDEKSMNPFKWDHVQNGGKVTDFRETISGFPCRLILVNDGETPLNTGQNEPTPGNTKDMGIFNFNNDKDNVTTLGFNSDIFPNCASYEVTANSDTSAGAFMSFNGVKLDCYTDTSWGNTSVKTDYFAVEDYDTPYSKKGYIRIFNVTGYDSDMVQTVYWDSRVGSLVFPENTAYVAIGFSLTSLSEEVLNDISNGDIHIKRPIMFNILGELLSSTVMPGNGIYFTQEDELKYLKESFELRHPDEDDVAEDWGFMGTGEEGTGLKALIDWVDNCTDEEFVRDFEQHFHKDYTLRYFCLVTLIGAVDNLGKNMMLDTADNKIYFPRFYDIDTICSYDNSGQLKFDVDIEMEQGYWNTSSSRLWTRIRDLMHDDIVTTYNNMRKNGVSYENMMHYIYDEQIAKIPQTYYNKDYDVKYAPFADSYIGMAHGDTYEHVKRWLKQRFTFVDTLFDYAPSYNNDILTIRANTTELMTLEIETYTPVYLHLSWYNGQMDKKKIDGKVSVEFSGKAQAATDQEVLIYGGSNVKSIKGIQSANPNRLILGSATKLTELDASNCPLLAEINMNKANLSPHEYLNKVNLSNCPLLEGNLRLNNSPLIQELDIRGTGITGMNLPSSIRNLQVLKLPNTMTELTLNDAGMLHTLEFDEGVKMQSVAMTNCNALENVINFDLLQTPSITLNNSYNTAAELYFRDTTNLSLSNMPNLERVIFTPNNEYETFELINVANAPDYKVTTFNCPKLSTFMTTAPYRESFNNVSGYVGYGPAIIQAKVYGDIQPNTTFTANSIDISSTQFTDVKLLCTTDTNTLKLPTTVKNFYCDSSFDLDTNYLEDGEYDVIHGELVEQYTTDYEGEVLCNVTATELFTLERGTYPWNDRTYHTDFIRVAPNTSYTSNMVATGFWCVTFLAEDKETVVYKYVSSNGADITAGNGVIPNNAHYMVFSCLNNNNPLTLEYIKGYVPNLIPSSADGSLIFSMYAPNNTVAPASGTWDLKGLAFDNFHTFGMNNDVKPSDGSCVRAYHLYNPIVIKGQLGGHNSGAWINSSETDLSRSLLFKGSELFDIVGRSLSLTRPDGFVCRLAYTNDGERTGGATSNIANPTMTYNANHTPKWICIDWNANNGLPEYFILNNIRIYLHDINEIAIESSSTPITTILDGHINSFSDCTLILPSIPTSLTMPARYDDYNIAIKNAYIAPKTHNTMLYPLLVNEDNPITGTLDYTNYAGKHLSWSFAYTDEEYVNITQPKDELLNSYEYKYNAFYDTEYEFDNPYEIARYTSSASGVLPTFNKEFTYTYDEKDNGDGTYTTKIYTDSLDNLPTQISFADKGGLVGIDKLNMSKVTDMSNMFRGQINLAYIKDVSNWDVNNVTNMTQVFYNTRNLISLDLSNWNTGSVTNMSGMFRGCSGLTSLDLSGFNTGEVTNMSNMFSGCSKLTTLDVSGFDTSNVNNMNSMFYNCSKLTEIKGIENWDCSKVTILGSMFQGATAFGGDLDLRNWKVGQNATVTEIFSFMNGCAITSVDMSGWILPDKINFANFMVNQGSLHTVKVIGWSAVNIQNICGAIGWYVGGTIYGDVIIDETYLKNDWTYDNALVIAKYTANATGVLPGFNTDFTGYTTGETDNGDGTYTVSIATDSLDNLPTQIRFENKDNLLTVSKLNISKLTMLANLFFNCKNLIAVECAKDWDTNNITNFDSAFYLCSNLAELDVSNWNVDNATSFWRTFYGCSSLTELDVSGFNTNNVTTMSSMFQNCSSLTSLDVSGFDTSNVTRMNNMFNGCSGLTSLDLSNFKTSNVTTMEAMFGNCTNLTELNLQGWKVRNINFMFNSCTNLQKVDTTNWDTSELTNIGHNLYQYSGLFYLCSSLTEIIGIENWNTSKIATMGATFKACSSLTTLDLSNWDTSSVTDLNGMFDGCIKLTSLDISGFDTSNVTGMHKMFNECQSLTSLDLSGFDTSKVTNMSTMFAGCSALTELVGLRDWDTSALIDVSYAFQKLPVTYLDLGGWDLTNCTAARDAWNFMYSLKSIVFPNNLSVSFGIGQSFSLTADNIVAIFNKLATVTTTQTAGIGTNLLNKLTDEQIAIATNKGWTVS